VALITTIVIGCTPLPTGRSPDVPSPAIETEVPASPRPSTSAPSASPAVAADVTDPVVQLRPACQAQGDVIAAADALLANRYTFSPHPTVRLPADPAWDENPLRDRNWEAQYHSLRYLWTLTSAWSQTGDDRYLDRALWLAADWYQDNDKSDPPSSWSWSNHPTAFRAMVYACLGEIVPVEGWLLASLRLHGRTLADPDFYVGHGNHALNQNLGLLEVGCLLGRQDWLDLAASRLSALVTESVDTAGVTNEQSIFYQAYNFGRYKAAAKRLAECGLAIPPAFARVDLMPALLAHGTLPNGEYEMLGDTSADRATVIPGTTAEFAATKGASGPKPEETAVTYAAGFAFVRTGWGESVPYEDEIAFSVRYGPGTRLHGHADGTALSLYGFGRRLLLDSGKYSYNHDAWRRYFIGRSAHNVVTVAGIRFDDDRPTRLTHRRVTPTMVDLTLRTTGNADVDVRRRVVISRRLGFAIVEDRLRSSSRRTYHQLWHLAPGSAPTATVSRVRTHLDRGNVLIRQLIPNGSVTVTTGARVPIQGWVSFRYNQKQPAPVASFVRTGRAVRYLTLLVPGAETVTAAVDDLHLFRDGYAVTIRVRGHTERVVVRGTTSSITPLD
jgi:hypothetical protein